MNHRERILAAVEHRPLDRFPTDIWAVPEVRERLYDYCGTREWPRVLDALDIDGILHLWPDYVGPALPDLGPERKVDEWGMLNQRQEYAGGVYWEQVGFPLANAQSIADLRAFPWPKPEWYDMAGLRDLAAPHADRAVMVGYTAIFYYHNKLRGLELSMLDLVERPAFSRYLIERVADTFAALYEPRFEALRGLAQFTQVTDDFGSQTGLLISRRMFNEFYRPWMERAIQQAKRFGLKVMHHDDGAIYSLIPDLIEMGVDVLNPIQWRCNGMDRVAIGRNHGGKLCFHGGVDNQQTLPFGTAEEVRAEVAENLRTLGGTGSGYIIAPCHNIQAITPLENILALYQAPRILGVG
jgi:uroporphyrinogen decarboxylase